jgi:ADP-heptose:LPS heptosyltransferase
LYDVATRYPDDKFLLITKKPLYPLFINKPANVEVFPVYTKDKHKGIKGLLRGISDINAVIADLTRNTQLTIDGRLRVKPAMTGVKLKVADLHSVIRSGIITFYFWLKGAKVALINKGRRGKRMLVRKNHKVLKPLKTSLERYQKVFEDLGYDTLSDFISLFPEKEKKEETWIGVAPLAKHHGKIYPLDQMEKVISLLNQRPGTKIFLFGGEEERELLEAWTKKYNHLESVAGRLPFSDEFSLMNKLDVMLSMDSANMHLASLVNTPVVSVWGATHPYAGFYGYRQDLDNAVQIDLPCRPCSVFGDKPCYRGDYACLKEITPEMIVEKIEKAVMKRG